MVINIKTWSGCNLPVLQIPIRICAGGDVIPHLLTLPIAPQYPIFDDRQRAILLRIIRFEMPKEM
jgi:hypothetical protein